MVGIKNILTNFWKIINTWITTNFLSVTEKGQANGLAELNSDGIVPSDQLDSEIVRRKYVTQAEYNALSEEEKMKRYVQYIITDGVNNTYSIYYDETDASLMIENGISVNQSILVKEEEEKLIFGGL